MNDHEGCRSRSPRTIRRSLARAAVLLGALAAFGATVPSPAPAKQARLFAGSFGEAGSSPANPYPFSFASGAGSIAVDGSSHDVYVADRGYHRVEKFDATGHFLFMLGQEVNKTALEEQATRKAEEDVCPAAGHPADVCQPGQPGTGVGAFIDPAYLAVDNSSGPSKGDLYVANTGVAQVNDEQTLQVRATEGGTFQLEYEHEQTVPIAYNAPATGAGSVEAALSSLAKLAGAVHVSGPPGNYTITLSVKAASVPELQCSARGLFGFNSCLVSTNERVEKFDSTGQPVTTWGEGGRLNAAGVADPPDPVAGPFGLLTGIAVDPSGNLWVSTGQEAVFEFRNDSSFLTGWSGPQGELAVDAADTLYFRSGPIDEYERTGKRIGVVAPSRQELLEELNKAEVQGEAVDGSTGDLYVSGRESTNEAYNAHGVVKRYDSSCHPVITLETPAPGCTPAESFGAGLIQGFVNLRVAVDPATHAVFVSSEEGRFIEFALLTVPDVATARPLSPTHTSATLTGTVIPSGVELNAGLAGCRFEWGESTAYGHVEPCDKSAAQVGSGGEPVEVHAAITGLQPGRTYHYRLVASNANDVNGSIQEPSFGADLAFGPPRVEAASVTRVADTTATLQAQVNPNDLDTRVHVEYGSEEGAYTQSTGAVDVGSSGSAQTASFAIAGLTPGATYHYRAVAENVLGEGPETVLGSDATVTTQVASSFSLPDERGWELVSPPDKRGALIESLLESGIVQAAADGSAVSYLANAPTEAMPPGSAEHAVQILSRRSPSGWASRDIPLAHLEAVGVPNVSNDNDYTFFSSDLSVGIAQPKGPFDPETSAEASEETPFLREDFSPSAPDGICSQGCYRPLVTGKAGYENVPAGTVFAKAGKCLPFASECGPQFLGATRDAAHVVLSSSAPLIEGVTSGAEELYEWTAGRLQLLSTLPQTGAPAPKNVEPVLGRRGSARNAISADGSRIIWSEHVGAHHLYVHDLSTEETLQLDVNQGGSGKGVAEPSFEAASSDGSVIFFTDEQRLTAGSGAADRAPDLYRCEIVRNEAGERECSLTDLTPAVGSESAAVQSMVGASEDGGTVYFFARGALTSAPNWRGEHAAPASCTGPPESPSGAVPDPTGSCNLYMVRGGTTTFIALLAHSDLHDWSGLASQPVRVSPNGRWLAFMSERSLTGYDNRDVATGKQVAEVYLYDAGANELRCASCNPTGARPHAVPFDTITTPQGIDLGGGQGSWFGGLVAATIPSWNSYTPGVASYQGRYLDDAGRLFFDSVDALVPQDSNGTLDVYEYEPPGVGSCSESAVTFGVRSGGCVGLISSGTSNRESVFLDASESGDDVFFLTAAQLSRRDSDTAYDVYDARVGGGEREPVGPVECQGSACQAIVAPPVDLTPGSLIFSGPGNLAPVASGPVVTKHVVKCKKGRRLRRGRCVKVRRAPRRKAARARHGRGSRR